MTEAASVVIASISGEAALSRCLESIVPQLASDDEAVVATCLTPQDTEAVRRSFPEAIFIHAPARSSVFELRSLGLGAARGPLVHLTEDHVIAGPRWVASLRSCHEGKRRVAGGPVDAPVAARGSSLALYLAEYAALMPPLEAGPAPYVSGVNSSYRRDALLLLKDTWRGAFYENEIHDALLAAGHELYIHPEAAVVTSFALPMRHALAHMFHGGRRYGTYRAARRGVGARLLFLLAWPLVPLMLVRRIFAAVRQRQPERANAARACVGWILALTAAWGLGEGAASVVPEGA